ncbi:MAG: LysR family transcriptional regulator [Oscillospiraceae bacterium]|nr:LysR family transcriptional regulator [Oscillospiraceae bacterium]
MEFKQLESFAAVVRLNSFTKAAESLYISQPTISTHIRALEEELNARLIMRTTKNIEVTQEGMKLYDYAVNILELRDRMVRECATGAKQIIHLGASTIPSAYILPEILPRYGKFSPNTFFVIHQSDSKGVMDGLCDGVYDVGLVGMPCEKENLHCVPFCKDRMVLITPVTERYLQLQAAGATPMDVIRESPVILREKGSGTKKSADFFLEQAGITDDQLEISARVNDPEAIKNLVAGGLGVSIISQRAAQNFLQEKRILSFSLPDQSNSRDLYVLYRRDQAGKSYVSEFVDFITRFYSADARN